MIKDFKSFYNRGTNSDPNFDPLSANLVFLEDTDWKILRQKLSPVFSSGKLKCMLPQLIECAEKLNKCVEKFADNNEPLEIKQIMSKFSIDVVASCAFGLNINTLDNPDSIFVKLGQKVFQPCWRNRLKQTLSSQYPELLRYLGWKSLPQRLETFFIGLVKDTISYREQNNIVRNDFLQLLMELRKQDMEKLNRGEIGDEKRMIMDDKLITSNAFVFFVAGFDTAASTLSYCMFELSRNPDIQEEAYQHILEVLEKHDGQLTYDAIKDMTLINQIFAETLRMYPPGVEVRRRVTRSCVIPDTTITLPKGLRVAIPLYCLQNDPNYFPDPEKFIPERFSKENRDTIRKGTYMPFGDGPRMCIGKRFAKIEMRVALIKLLLDYKFTLNQKTITPLVFDSTSFMLVPIGGLWLNVQKRQ
uniref:Cytochrome P450 6HF1 n=1 Tax=Triatoma infestans TaxID=30076 RepID=A0A171B5Z2_TRIIF